MNTENSSAFDRHTDGCIYCGRPGPHTDEHVVPAGLGGDDKNWMLKGRVCAVCNNQIFSRMETHVFKASHIGLMRLYSQPATRDGTPPSPLQVPTTVQLGDEGLLAAGHFSAGGEAAVFAQIVFKKTDAGAIAYQILGPDRPAVDQLFTTVREHLEDEVVLIEKHGPKRFTATTLRWAGDRYLEVTSTSLELPPRQGIWLEPGTRAASVSSTLDWTLFQRPSRQLAARSPDLNHLRALLSVLRTDLDRLAQGLEAANVESNSGSPNVHLGMTIDMTVVDRVMTKIGLNLVAYLLGDHVVREAAFDAAVGFVLGTVDGIQRALIPAEAVGPLLPGRHVIYLMPCEFRRRRPAIVVMLQLYSAGPVQSFVLAEFEGTPPLCEPIVIHVDYVANRIERMTLEEHAQRCLEPMNVAISFSS